MATFAAVNSSLSALTSHAHADPHSTPATSTTITSAMHREAGQADRDDGDGDESCPSTPTRHSFAGMLGQRPLPSEPLSSHTVGDRMDGTESKKLDGSQHTDSTSPQTMEDVEMGEGDDDDNAAEDDGSDNDSVTSDSQRPSKKKKGQRFFCTDYPPCQLSFTRSEHLARHIRKHTGERPFQCHCSRRFSRLDNLRQHAQTVHVNEEIPGDSLAATSTRFQRQIRTDRVRPPGSRSRANTLGSQGGHSRGHSRNLSASSITSTSSTMSIPEEVRRRPQPLAMAGNGDARAGLAIDTYNAAPSSQGSQYGYYNQSPNGYTTPTSTTFSTGPTSPHFHQPGMASPSSTASRSSAYNGVRSHTRRLSVPSSPHPFQPQQTQYPSAYYSPASSAAFSPSGSSMASPTSSVFSHSRHQSESEMDIRRRTWHASNNQHFAQRPATSGLTYHQTPDQPRPAFSQQPAASQLTRLPGIESFDHAPPTAVRQQPSPMLTDDLPRPTSSGRPFDASGLHHGLTRLDITTANATPENQWQASHGGHYQSQSHFQPPHASQSQQPYVHPHHLSMPEQPVTPRKNKRNAWYGGPVTPSYANFASVASHRPSPEDSGSSEGVKTPALAHATEHHPVIYNHGEGYLAPEDAHQHHHHHAVPPPAGHHHKVYYSSAGAEPKPEPIRADAGFQQGFPPPSAPQQQHQDVRLGMHPQMQHPQQPPPPPPSQMYHPNMQSQPQTYTLQTGHDPRFAQANQGPSSDSTRLDALVTAALGSSEGSRAANGQP